MQQELEDIFSIFKKGTQEETKDAKQRIDKLWKRNSKNFKKHATIALEQLKEFDRIQNPKNQEAFVSGDEVEKMLIQAWLTVVDDFRTANWVEIIKYPELVYQKSVGLLSA